MPNLNGNINRKLFNVNPGVKLNSNTKNNGSISNFNRINRVTSNVKDVTNSRSTNGNKSNNNNNNNKMNKRNVVDFLASGVEAYNNLPPNVKTGIKTGIKAGLSGKIPRVFNSPTIRSNGSNSGEMSYGLSNAPIPKPVSLNSGIIPNTYTSDYLTAEEGSCSPLHVSACNISIPLAASNRIFDYFNKIIAFDIQTRAQSNVGFDLKVDTDFTPDKILVAMNSLINALQVYYYFTSIISYHSDSRNKNEGMIYLRSGITPAILDDVYRLGRRLEDTPCPPNLLEWIRFLSANYYSGSNQGSAMIKIVPNVQTVLASTDQFLAAEALSALSTSANNQVYTLLRRAVPQWRINKLYDVDPLPYYNANFLTIFANLPAVTERDGDITFIPTVAYTDTVISFNSFTNMLDGAAMACTSVYYDNNSDWEGGLVRPPADTLDNILYNDTRLSFYSVSNVKQFYKTNAYPFLIRSRLESYIANDTNTSVLTPHLYGTDKCLNVNSLTLNQTSLNTLDFLMSLDTIKNPNQSGFSKKANIN